MAAVKKATYQTLLLIAISIAGKPAPGNY